MSDHPREAEHHLKRINICDDVWYGVFAWSTHAELGLQIAPISARFDQLVDRHLRTIRWTIGHIGLRRRSMHDSRAVLWKNGNVNSGVLLEKSALLDVPPPSNLIGFQKIEIRYVDQSVIAFLRRICHHFNTVNTTLMVPFSAEINGINQLRFIVTHFWPLIAQRLYQLTYDINIDFMRIFASPTVLRKCANLRVIHAGFDFPEMPADDGAGASSGQAMAKWLHTPRSEGRPKVLKCRGFSEEIATKLEGLKMAFVNAESPVAYIICVRIHKPNVEPFEFVNERTRERMTIEKTTVPEQYEYYWLLKRGPFWWGKSEWAESEHRAKASVRNLLEEMNLICCDKNLTFCNNLTDY